MLWTFGIFYEHLGYFLTIWYILCSFVTFFRFWYHEPRKIWQPRPRSLVVSEQSVLSRLDILSFGEAKQDVKLILIKQSQSRVTRLGEFSPFGWLFTFGNFFLKILKVVQNFGLLLQVIK
jgi:hypothetical protein